MEAKRMPIIRMVFMLGVLNLVFTISLLRTLLFIYSGFKYYDRICVDLYKRVLNICAWFLLLTREYKLTSNSHFRTSSLISQRLSTVCSTLAGETFASWISLFQYHLPKFPASCHAIMTFNSYILDLSL
jgi:hypothetical protein